ncbi:hypothetical protein [Nocardia sp. NBC_00403]
MSFVNNIPGSGPDVAAAHLIQAAANRQPCAPVRDLIGSTDVGAASSR